MAQNDSKPYCFGVLDSVFPMGPDDFRQTPESCFVCRYKTACLKTAMSQSDGIRAREESVDRAYRSGMISFWERWSQKKVLQRRIQALEKGVDVKKGD